MRRARSVTGPLRRAHPASGATWNVQVVRGKMSSQCLWHACRALSAGLLLMLLGAAMAVIGYYAESLSVAEEIRGNATISVKDEARGFHLNNLSYAGPIVMGFGGFIVVAACVMTFEARDSAAKVTPARPQSIPRPAIRQAPRRAPNGITPARLDQLGVYLPHPHVPLAHALPLAPSHRHRHHLHANNRNVTEKEKCHNRYGSAPDLRAAGSRAVSIAALRRPLRRYALSVDEPPHSTFSASAADSECGSQSSLAMELHGSGGTAGVTLRVRDNTRRRPLARQSRLREDMLPLSTAGSSTNMEGSTVSSRNRVIGPRVPSGRPSLPLLADVICEAIPNEWPVLLRINESAVSDHLEIQHDERSSNDPPEQVQVTMVHHLPDICIQIEESPPHSEQNPEDVVADIQPSTEEHDVIMSDDPC